MCNELILKAAEIMNSIETGVLALVDENGFPRASTISNLKTEGIGRAWFSTGLSTGKVRCIQGNNKAGLCYCDGKNNITLMGTIKIFTDLEIKKELWEDWFIDHFPGGIHDPEYCILRFDAEKAVLWVDSKYQEFDLKEPTI